MSIASDAPPAASSRPAIRVIYSPWAHVVRGDADAAPAAMHSSPSAPILPSSEPCDRLQTQQEAASFDDGTASFSVDASLPPPPPPPPSAGEDGDLVIGSNAASAARGKKAAWVVPPPTLSDTGDAGKVMGALAWPALSESTKPAPRSSSSESLKDKSISVTPEPVISSPRSRTNTNSPSPIYATNHAGSSYQKPNTNPIATKRGNDGNRSSGGSSVSGEPTSPKLSSASLEMPSVGSGRHLGLSHKDPPNKGTNLDRHHRGGFTSQPHSGSDHYRGYGGNRRGNNGGDGSRLHYGHNMNRRDHERGGLDWNSSRGFYGRDPHAPMPLHQQRSHQRPFMQQPPPAPVPFIGTPPHFRPFGHMSFPDYPAIYYVPAPQPLDPIMNMPFAAPVPPALPQVFIPPPNYRENLLKQIDYYFGTENLCRDTFLRMNMDNEGWVSVYLIANFNKVKELTSSISYILDTLQSSTVVEVQGDRVRRRGDWKKWILPPMSNQNKNALLSARLQSVRLDEASSSQMSIGVQTSDGAGHSMSASGSFNQMNDPDIVGDGNRSTSRFMHE